MVLVQDMSLLMWLCWPLMLAAAALVLVVWLWAVPWSTRRPTTYCLHLTQHDRQGASYQTLMAPAMGCSASGVALSAARAHGPTELPTSTASCGTDSAMAAAMATSESLSMARPAVLVLLAA